MVTGMELEWAWRIFVGVAVPVLGFGARSYLKGVTDRMDTFTADLADMRQDHKAHLAEHASILREFTVAFTRQQDQLRMLEGLEERVRQLEIELSAIRHDAR